jgi:hypothetical protein
MTKKQIRTKRRRVKKQMKRKSRKMRKTKKSMKGGNLIRIEFIKQISKCIPNDPKRYPDMPFSPTGYTENEDNWTKLAQNISENGPIEFQCDGENAVIGGIDENLKIDYKTNTKRGELYGKIGNSPLVLLWRNGRQQTYEERPRSVFGFSQTSPVTPPRITRENVPPPLNRRNTNQGLHTSDIPIIDHDNNDIGVSLFENYMPNYRAYTGYNSFRNTNRNYNNPNPARRQ